MHRKEREICILLCVMILNFIARIMTESAQKSKKNAKSKVYSFIWTDGEVELLLKVTMESKTSKATENVDWESGDVRHEIRPIRMRYL